jgi:lysozyme family protein
VQSPSLRRLLGSSTHSEHDAASASTFQVHPCDSHSAWLKQLEQASSHAPGHSSRKHEMSWISQSAVQVMASGCHVPPSSRQDAHSSDALSSVSESDEPHATATPQSNSNGAMIREHRISRGSTANREHVNHHGDGPRFRACGS